MGARDDGGFSLSSKEEGAGSGLKQAGWKTASLDL